jgi:hypothetical protein
MFRALVARRVRTAWEHLARRDYGYVLDQLAPTFTHSFAGDHSLGGARSSRGYFASFPTSSSSLRTYSFAAGPGGHELSP